jgi:NitT/TauT family transport system substrate-binding protein
MFHNWLQFSLVFAVFASLVSCSGGSTGKTDSADTGDQLFDSLVVKQQKVRLMPYWVTSAQFAGYYVGIEKGIFRKYGIDLEMMKFDPFVDTRADIESGRADFALLWLTNAVKLKSEGVDIVNIAQLSTRSSLMLLAKKSSGIRKISDLNGKKAGIWAGFEMPPKALFAKYGLDVKMITIGSTNTLFLLDGVDVINANWFDEYHSILNNGYDSSELVPFFYADYGLNFLEDGIYCLSQRTRTDPALCAAFVKATLESWMYAFGHPEETLDIVIRIARNENRPVNRSHQNWMLQRYRELYIAPGKDSINTLLSRADYLNVCRIMQESRLISEVVPYGQFFNAYTSFNKKTVQ